MTVDSPVYGEAPVNACGKYDAGNESELEVTRDQAETCIAQIAARCEALEDPYIP